MYIIIAGAGVMGSQISKLLLNNHHDVVIIDIDKEVCEKIYSETGAVTIHGNATDLNTLNDSGIERADIMLCLLSNDSDNIAASVLAKSLNLPRIIAFARKPMYEDAYKAAGVDVVIKLSDILLNQIIMEIEQPPVKEIAKLGTGNVGIYAINIPKNSKAMNKSIKDITSDKNFPVESVFIGIFREKEDNFLIPRGNNHIKPNDRIFLVSKNQYIKKITKILLK